MSTLSKVDVTERLDVSYVARLARIALTPEEATCLQSQMDQILVYIRKIRELDLDGVEPTMHAQAMQNVFRPDTVKPGLDREVVLRNAPSVVGEQFQVPKIVE